MKTNEETLSRLYLEITPTQSAQPNRVEALEFRRDQYGLTRVQFSVLLGMGPPHYNEFCNGKRDLPLKATKRAYAIGVPAKVLLQI